MILISRHNLVYKELSKQRSQHAGTADAQRFPTSPNIVFQTVPAQSYTANCNSKIQCNLPEKAICLNDYFS